MTNKPNDVRVSRELLERVSSQELGMTAKKDRQAAAQELRAILAQPADQQGETPRATEKDIERWHALIAESPEGPWVMGNGGSFDRQGVKPISDELMSELGQWLRMGYTPWNGRSVSPTDRQFMYLLYYSVQGLVSRVRRAERDLHSAQPAEQQEDEGCDHEFIPFQKACAKCGELYSKAPVDQHRQSVAFIQIPKNIGKYGHGDDPDRLKFGNPGQFFVNGESPMFDFVPLYLHAQPATAKVVLPERKREATEDSDIMLDCQNEGWNACLDEVAKLNTPQ